MNVSADAPHFNLNSRGICKKKMQPGHIFPFPCGAVLTLTRSLLTLSGVERGLHGHPDLSTAMQPHTHKKIPSTMYSHTFLSKPALTSAIWAPAAHPSDQTAQANFSFTHASVSLTYPWPCRRYSAVSSSDNLWCILTTHCRLDAPHKSCSFRDALTQLSSHHSRPLSNLVISLHLSIFLFLSHQTLGTKCSPAAWYIPSA